MAELNQSSKADGKVRSKKASTKIDMTPMVDLAFLLLTFFMLATTFNRPQTMEVMIPEKPKAGEHQPEVNEKKVLTLVLGAHDKIYWYRGITKAVVAETDYTTTGVHKVLMDSNAEIAEMVVLIKPMDESRYRNVVDILDEMSVSTVARYAMVDITNEDLALVQTKTTGL